MRYVVNTHNHFDHSGGLRAAVAEGAALIAQAQSRAWYEKAFANPNRIAPDPLAKSGRKLKVVPVNEKLVLDDGARKVEVYRVHPSDHVDTLLDGVPAGGEAADPGRRVHAGSAELAAAGAAQQLQPAHPGRRDRAAQAPGRAPSPLHGRIVPNAELYRAAGR